MNMGLDSFYIDALVILRYILMNIGHVDNRLSIIMLSVCTLRLVAYGSGIQV